MKKKTADEKRPRKTEPADRSVTDPAVAAAMLCDLLYQLKQPLESELLYDTCVTGGIINFFAYQEAIASLLEQDFIKEEKTASRETVYSVTLEGTDYIKTCETIPETAREQLSRAVRLALRKNRNLKNAMISYEPLERGCHLHVVLMDRDLTLLDIRLFTPDKETAQQLGERILTNPSALYHDVLHAVLTQHEAPNSPAETS